MVKFLKYILMPGFVLEGTMPRYISASQLAEAYGVSLKECYTQYDISLMTGMARRMDYLNRRVLLRPDPTGKYRIPNFVGWQPATADSIDEETLVCRSVAVKQNSVGGYYRYIPMWNITDCNMQEYKETTDLYFITEKCNVEQMLCQINGTGFGLFYSEEEKKVFEF